MGTIADNGAIFERALRIEQRLERELSALPFALQNALIHARTVLDVGCDCGAWTECELPITSSPAWQSLCSLLCRALDEIGQRYAPPTEIERLMAELRVRQGIAEPERTHLCITPRLACWLTCAGFEEVQSIAHAIDISAYAPAHGEFVELAETFFAQVRPMLVTTGLIQEAKLGKLIETARRELQESTSAALFLV
jgi:hypothetical protein